MKCEICKEQIEKQDEDKYYLDDIMVCRICFEEEQNNAMSEMV